ncbi:MAG: DNA (cytosine-5-)-methyltransferase [Planctomycetes bacterium]|nr:DNA (cytosine-5-)-methyltransferase [Planctomycetota bacterium]
MPVKDKTRQLEVTAGNLRNNHLYVNKHLDFFPADVIGTPRKNGNGDHRVEIVLDGLNTCVKTDIGSDRRTGKSRGFIRERASIGKFYAHHQIKAGSVVTLERLSERKYRLSAPANGESNGRPKAAEFFAGIGLVRLALERQGWDVVFANDICEDKAQMYQTNWPSDDHLVVEDIHKLKAKDIPDCDLFTASFPCNDLSIAGRWEGLSGKESSAFWGLTSLLENLKDRAPRLVLLENVVGFLMSRGGQDFEQALLELNRLGYTADAVILNAQRWVPQSRARLFVIAQRDEGGERNTLAQESDARSEALCKFIFANQHIRWNIRSLPRLPKPQKQLTDILEDLPDNDKHWWNQERTDYFMSQLSNRHREQADRMIRGRSYSYATAFRRVRYGKSMAELRTDGIAGCLRTPRGGSGRQILFKAGRGKYRVRLLTARECARLQGVPDSFKIEVSLNQALFGFGDAVCVPAVEWLIEKYVGSLTR